MSEEEKKVENTTEQPEAKAEEPKAEEAKVEQSKTEEPKKEEVKAEEKSEAKPKAEKKEEKKEDAKYVADGKPRAPTKPKEGEAAEGGKDSEEAKDGKKKRGGGKKGSKRRSRAQDDQQSEFIEKVVQVRRVTKVVKGGKKLSFRVSVIIGNEKGKVGVGVGKASEVLTAIKKALADARKSLIDVETVANSNTISHPVQGIATGSKVLLKPAAEGTGIIAGGTARIVLELAGVGDILAKSQGSKSPLNVARATLNALKQLRNFQEVASLRGISVKKMLFA